MEQPLDLAHGTVISELRYKAWGEVRYASAATPTKYTYTGQYSYASDFGLLYYNARWLDPALGRFAQADAIISSNGQGFDRYLYTNNNPIRFIDPSGHKCVPEDECEGMSNGVGFSVSINWTGMIADKFGVTLSGNWTPENAHRVYASLTYMNVKLAGGKLAMFTAGTTYTFQYNAEHYGGKTSRTGDITFWSFNSVSPYQNIYHEIAHSIDYKSDEFFTNRLRSQKVYTDDGQFVMGGPDRWSKPAGTYGRNSLGYNKERLDDSAFTRQIIAEQHPADQGGNDADEEFGDLVANYMADNFVTDPTDPRYQYGIARQNWVSSAFVLYFYTQNVGP